MFFFFLYIIKIEILGFKESCTELFFKSIDVYYLSGSSHFELETFLID